MRPVSAGAQTLRTGFTTGACAAAAAKAAVRVLSGEDIPDTISLKLPRGRFSFPVSCIKEPSGAVTCSVIKDAGDDPDVTHGLEIQAEASLRIEPGLTLLGGEGVGIVTLPGLPVAVGGAAINPGPQRLIRAAVEEELDSARERGNGGMGGVTVTIRVPEGRRIASQTMNPRLGIQGGISILGTDGLVRPYSTAAYRTSVYYALKVAAAAGKPVIVLATGRRSEEYAARLLEIADGIGVVNAGDDIAYALKQIDRLGFDELIIAGMIGKISKLAQGRLNTHVDQGGVDFNFLSKLVRGLGYTGNLEVIRKARTAHYVQTVLRKANIPGLESTLARRTLAQVSTAFEGKKDLRVLVFNLQGELLADECQERTHG